MKPRTEGSAARKIAFICSTGEPTRTAPALLLANAARLSGIDTYVLFTFDGLRVVRGAAAARGGLSPDPWAGVPRMEPTRRIELPCAAQMVHLLRDSGANLYACALSMQMLQLERADLGGEVTDVITVCDFHELTEDAQVLYV
jgi:peroxiredoxin family protein